METKNHRYHNSSIEELLAFKFKETSEQVKISAQSFGPNNLPQLVGDQMRFYFEEFHLLHQQLIDTVGGIIQPDTSVHEVVEHSKATDYKDRDLQNKLNTAKSDHITTKAKIEGKPSPVSEIKVILCWAAIFIICLFDGVMAINVFESAGFTYLEAVVVAILFSTGLAIACHYSTKIIQLGKTPRQRKLIVAIIILFMGALFYCMTIMRIQFLTETLHANDSGIQHSYSPTAFILFSIFFFCVGMAISYLSLPTKEQMNYLREYKRLKREIQEGEEHIEFIERQKDAVKNEHANVKGLNGSMLVYGNSTEERIIHHAFALYSLWMKENLFYRSDKGKPSCFDQAYPFVFLTNFDRYKSMSHEILA